MASNYYDVRVRTPDSVWSDRSWHPVRRQMDVNTMSDGKIPLSISTFSRFMISLELKPILWNSSATFFLAF
jgi:hypothetical protein